MRRRLTVLFLALFLAGLSGRLSAEMVRVDGVEGQVLYGAGDRVPSVSVKVGQTLGAGTFSAAANGILYLSTFAGSELRLAEAGTLRFSGMEETCPVEHASGHRSTFQLLSGKLRVTIRNPEKPPHCYRIMLTGGSASIESGQCVMCRHGGGTYLFVARGAVMLVGAGPDRTVRVYRSEAGAISPIWLKGNGEVGVLNTDGTVRIEPLSAMGAGVQICLLAGLQPDAAAHGKNHNPVDASRHPFTVDAAAVPLPRFHQFIVSPIQ